MLPDLRLHIAPSRLSPPRVAPILGKGKLMPTTSDFPRLSIHWIVSKARHGAMALLWLALLLLAVGFNLRNYRELSATDAFSLGSLLHDDAYYYLMIAQNIVHGNGITFDGLHPTTGFQPLYQGITVGLTFLADWSQVSIFRLIFGLNLIFAILTAAALIRLEIRAANGRTAWPILLPALMLPLNFPLLFKRLGAGMEMGTSLLLLALWLQVLCSPALREYRMRRRLLEGLLLGTLTLTRIDYSILGLVHAIYLVRAWRARVPSQWAALIAGYVIPLGIYAVVAHLSMDSLIPVSFLVKQFHSSQQLSSMTPLAHLWNAAQAVVKIWLFPVGYLLYGLYWRWRTLGLALGAATVALLAVSVAMNRRHWRPRGSAASGLLWFGWACFAHALVLAWFGPTYVGSAYFWYYTPELLALVVGLSFVFANLRGVDKASHQVAAWLAAAVVVASVGVYGVAQDVESYAPYRAMIETVKRLTPASARIGSWDAGFNAYWLLPRTVVNLDGMVNSRAYLDTTIKSGEYADYLRAEQIAYILNMVPYSSDQQSIVQNAFFRHPSIDRSCYDILAEMPFERQRLNLYLLKYRCAPGPG